MVTADQTRKRKVRAVLASGLVLGVGAVITLAAWNDSVFGNAEFGTGDSSWNVQGNFDGEWREYIERPGGTMEFTMEPGDMVPGKTVYAPVGLKEEHGKFAADVKLQPSGNTSTLAEALRLSVTSVADRGACAAGNTGNAIAGWPDGSGGSTVASAGSAADLQIPAGSEKWLCFAVTLPADTNPSGLSTTTGTVVWEFEATSVDGAQQP